MIRNLFKKDKYGDRPIVNGLALATLFFGLPWFWAHVAKWALTGSFF